MQTSTTADRLITDAQVSAILDDLNAGDAGLEDLDRWADRSSLKPDRVIVGPDTVYVRLTGRAERGGPVILMYVERAWTRATRTAPVSPVEDIARHRAQRRGTAPAPRSGRSGHARPLELDSRVSASHVQPWLRGAASR